MTSKNTSSKELRVWLNPELNDAVEEIAAELLMPRNDAAKLLLAQAVNRAKAMRKQQSPPAPTMVTLEA